MNPAQPLTILNVAYPFAPVRPETAGGAEQILSCLDRALVRAGHRSLVLAHADSQVAGHLLPTPVPPGPITDDLRRHALRTHAHNLLLALHRYPVDVVHMHGIDFHQYLPSPTPPAGANVPFLITLHLPPDWYPPQVFSLRRPSTYMHCVSESQHRRCPPHAQLLAPIPNGVPQPPLHNIRKRRFALALGRICPEKNLHAALDAAQRADMPLLLGGHVFPYPAHQHYFTTHIRPRLDRRRRYLGPLGPRKKFRLLAAATALLLPTLAPETSSLVAMESLAAGTPVIAYPSGAIPSIIEHEKTGFLVSSPAEMAQALHRAPSIDPEACRAAARQRFSLQRMTERYVELYHQLARNPDQHATLVSA